MSTFKLALRNLAKKPLRTVLAIATVTVSITLLLSLLGFYFGYNKAMRDELNNFGVQMLAVPKGCPYSSTTLLLHGGVIPNKLPLGAIDKVKAIQHVKSAQGIVMGTLELDGVQHIIYGISPGFEKLRPNWKVQGKFPIAEGELVLGSTIAKKLGAEIGKKYTVIGIAQDKKQQEELGTYPPIGQQVITYKTDPRELTVVGLLDQTGASEDNFFITNDSEARKVIDLNGYTAIAIELDDQAGSKEFVAIAVEGVNDAQPVTINQVANTVSGLIDSARSIMLSVVIVAILACAIVVAGTALMGVIERSKEIGMMRTIGATPMQVGTSVGLEVVLLTLIGGIIGIVLTLVLQNPLSNLLRILIPNAPNTNLVSLPPDLLLLSIGIAVALGVLASIPPLISAVRAPPLRMAGS